MRLFSRDRGETETLKPDTEAKNKTFRPEAEARQAFEISTEARPSRGTTAPRDGLETEASRPRPHPCNYNVYRLPLRLFSITQCCGIINMCNNYNNRQSNLAIGGVAANWGFRTPNFPFRGRLRPLANTLLLGTTGVSLKICKMAPYSVQGLCDRRHRDGQTTLWSRVAIGGIGFSGSLHV